MIEDQPIFVRADIHIVFRQQVTILVLPLYQLEADALCENAIAVVRALVKAKPASAKGVYIQSVTLSGTMTPGIKIDTREVTKEMP